MTLRVPSAWPDGVMRGAPAKNRGPAGAVTSGLSAKRSSFCVSSTMKTVFSRIAKAENECSRGNSAGSQSEPALVHTRLTSTKLTTASAAIANPGSQPRQIIEGGSPGRCRGCDTAPIRGGAPLHLQVSVRSSRYSRNVIRACHLATRQHYQLWRCLGSNYRREVQSR